MSHEEVTLAVQDPILGSCKIWLSQQKLLIPTILSTRYNSKCDAWYR